MTMVVKTILRQWPCLFWQYGKLMMMMMMMVMMMMMSLAKGGHYHDHYYQHHHATPSPLGNAVQV